MFSHSYVPTIFYDVLIVYVLCVLNVFNHKIYIHSAGKSSGQYCVGATQILISDIISIIIINE